MMAKKASKNLAQKKPGPGRHFAKFLIPSLVLVALVFIGEFVSNETNLIYPMLHKNQLSPVKYIEESSKKLPLNVVKPEVLEHGSRVKHRVALTFDADMTPAMYNLLQKGIIKSLYNEPVKQTLDREQVKATIFLTGLWAKAYPKQAYEIAHDPLFEIGNHSTSHFAFSKNCYKLPVLSDMDDKNDVLNAQKVIQETTGVTPKYFRFPGGCYDQYDLETIARLGLTIVHWDVVAEDGFNQNSGSIVQKVVSNVQNGSIVVFHIHGGSYAPKTNDALAKIIPILKRQGYQFVTISEMFAN